MVPCFGNQRLKQKLNLTKFSIIICNKILPENCINLSISSTLFAWATINPFEHNYPSVSLETSRVPLIFLTVSQKYSSYASLPPHLPEKRHSQILLVGFLPFSSSIFSQPLSIYSTPSSQLAVCQPFQFYKTQL